MEKEKLRSEIEEKYKWDLTRIYKNLDDFNKDLEEVKKLTLEIPKFKGKLFSNSKTLEEYLRLEETIDKLINKLHVYSHLKADEDVADPKYQKLNDMVMSSYYDIANVDCFFEEEFFKEDYEKIEKMLDESEFLKTYKLQFARVNRYRDHFLSADKEQLVSNFSKALDTTDNIYNVLTNSEIDFGTIKDENNNLVELNEANYSIYIKSHNREVRRNAFKKLYEAYGNLKNTIAAIYIGNIDSNIALTKTYNFKSKLQQHLYADAISEKVYDNLIDTVNNNLTKLHEYYDFKKKVLNLDEFHLYDTFVPIVEEENSTYTYQQAKDIVLEIIKPLGEDYQQKAQNIFNNKLVDVMPNANKRGGAYSLSSYDTDPYILTNFKGKYTDISTIAHELGHSMHTIYSRDNNLRQYYNYTTFVAEVASTVNELLLAFHFIENSKDKKEKLYIINNLLDNYKATIYRQTMFAEFEREIYKRKENKESLTHEDISNYYLELNKKYFGESVFVDEDIKYEWERIPHFYTPFYVYQYATCISAAIVIANKIYNGDQEFRDKYIKFLSLGGSMWPIDELKTLGINMEEGVVIEEALDSFAKLLDEFMKLYNDIYNN